MSRVDWRVGVPEPFRELVAILLKKRLDVVEDWREESKVRRELVCCAVSLTKEGQWTIEEIVRFIVVYPTWKRRTTLQMANVDRPMDVGVDRR